MMKMQWLMVMTIDYGSMKKMETTRLCDTDKLIAQRGSRMMKMMKKMLMMIPNLCDKLIAQGGSPR